LLAEHGWNFLSSISTSEPHPLAVLDFGTGSGCLAITLAVKCPAAEVYAVDISAEALAVAGQNAARHGVSERVRFVQGDGFTSLPPTIQFHLLIANPPYIPSGEIDRLEPEVREHDPRPALDGGPDGLDFFRRLASEAAAWLKPEGRIVLEFGEGQASALRRLFEAEKWIVERIVDDYTQHPRILIGRK
jgi:release factor glutamine methyltransferase